MKHLKGNVSRHQIANELNVSLASVTNKRYSKELKLQAVQGLCTLHLNALWDSGNITVKFLTRNLRYLA